MSSGTFTFRVDGIEIEAAAGQTIIQACDAAGIVQALLRRPSILQVQTRQWPAGSKSGW